jgi:hypothetical protein
MTMLSNILVRRARLALTAIRPVVATSVLALAATGCQQADQPTEQDYNDVATSVGSLVASGEVTSVQDSVATAHGEIPFGFTSTGSGQIEGERGGLRYSYEVACTDADGVTMAACDATTDSASLIVDWSGNFAGDYWQFEIARAGEWRVTGLQSDVAVFTGEGTFDVSSTSQSLDGRRDRSFALSYAASYDIQWDMVVERVVEGTITYDVHAERHVDGQAVDRDAVFDIAAEVIFDGSATARLVLDGSHSYNIDIATGVVSAQ